MLRNILKTIDATLRMNGNFSILLFHVLFVWLRTSTIPVILMSIYKSNFIWKIKRNVNSKVCIYNTRDSHNFKNIGGILSILCFLSRNRCAREHFLNQYSVYMRLSVLRHVWNMYKRACVKESYLAIQCMHSNICCFFFFLEPCSVFIVCYNTYYGQILRDKSRVLYRKYVPVTFFITKIEKFNMIIKLF